MSDDSDLLIAAAATAAVVTWMGSRSRERRDGSTRKRQDWQAQLKAAREGFLRSWRETPGYQFYQGVRDALSRKKR